ncbi:MAG: 50S ribosomal protein L25 [Candidatus Margulisbacteria bacterium]|nr:50S ribosomal protein L25 [Candidatus Margulisiibacteriota bacterium]MBU1616943.1 50S ribosomal protein L25 [Candidatus Margulisiibacteriota bacterium]MBU1867683.1 50S ribosomal protein L25 [Candidatus Margulisiibacteriota bacterium]
MKKVELAAKKREAIGTKKLKSLRKEGFIPAIVYGRKIKPVAVAIERKAFLTKILGSETGKNTIASLKVGGETLQVLTQDIQFDAVEGTILHIDFNHIVMDEAIKTKVAIELTGIPAGVKESGGILVHGLREVEIECLPGDIPEKFHVDVTALLINDSLHVSDLPSGKYKLLSNAADMIASCVPPAKEEEVAPAAAPIVGEATAEDATAVADEKVKEKAAPGAQPAKAAPAGKPEKAAK